ncbi:phosphatidylserine/phosphatidylglycerophosphate/cardiolipin synthase family protein [Anaerolentibacter hominis]|uniref:phospholipase D-like domain-containing protein n=1 Tax=Anaerolentibacter hominis TaxID=3079009 RepID=UPI0031B7FE91
MRRVLKIAGGAAVTYGIFALTAGVFAYLVPRKSKKPVKTERFYGESEGVDRIMLVEGLEDSFQRRVEIIRQAKKTLDVSCHCVKAGQSGDFIFGELLRAADRGVKVRVLFDGTVGGMHGEHRRLPLALNSHPNMEFRSYLPVRFLKPWEWNVLLHDKFMIADDSFLMLGGRNMGDEYFNPPGYTGALTHDRDVMVCNTAAGSEKSRESVVWEVRGYMEKLWQSRAARRYVLNKSQVKQGIREQKRLKNLCGKWELSWPEYVKPSVPAVELMVPTSKIHLVSNPLTPFKKIPEIGRTLEALGKEGRDIWIQSPYISDNPHILKAFREMTREGGTLRVITNSMASTPNPPAFSDYYFTRKKFVGTGVRLLEYQQSRKSIHAKSFLMDGRFSVVGSFNLDDRSIYIDTETVLVVDSPAFNQILSREFETLSAQCLEVGADNRYVPDAVVRPCTVPAAKRGLMAVVSVISRLFRFLI